MGDIDFDELDRAVNSLMDQAGTTEGAVGSDTPQSQVQGSPSLVDDDISVPIEAPAVVAAAVPTPIANSSPSIGRRVGGRFMDVIPSAGTPRVAMPRPTPSSAPSRESASLQPETPDMSDEMSVSEYFEEDNASELPQSDYMDTVPGSTAPLTSPFLEGVEIDKRPLGGAPSVDAGYADESVEPINANELAMPDPIDFADEALPAPSDSPAGPWGGEAHNDSPSIEEPLQPELSPEVLAVETMPLESGPAGMGQGMGVPVPPSRPVSAPTPKPKAAWGSEIQPKSVPDVAPPIPQVPMSGGINPQYASVPTDAPEPSAVFDAASEAPTALHHPQKKKTGWSVVLWILLMVVVGVAAGVAVWYFLVK